MGKGWVRLGIGVVVLTAIALAILSTTRKDDGPHWLREFQGRESVKEPLPKSLVSPKYRTGPITGWEVTFYFEDMPPELWPAIMQRSSRHDRFGHFVTGWLSPNDRFVLDQIKGEVTVSHTNTRSWWDLQWSAVKARLGF